MGIVAIPVTYVDANILTAAQLNLCNTNIYNEFNGNIDNSNIKANANIDASKLLNASITNSKLASTSVADSNLDYSSVKVMRAGPNIPGLGPNGRRLACGKKNVTFPGSSIASLTVTYSTDAEDGNPTFAASPIVTFGIEIGGGSNQYHIAITANLASGFTIQIISSAGADASTITIHWHASGPV